MSDTMTERGVMMCMQSVTLATSHFLDDFRRELNSGIKDFTANGVKIFPEEELRGEINIWNLKFIPDDVSEKIKDSCANSICNFIFNYWEKELLHMIISRYYYHLTSPEHDYVFGKAITKLRELEKIDLLQSPIRKLRMQEKIVQFLKETNYLNIDGFVQFRNKEYLESLREIIDSAVEEYYLDKEYAEFVNLLKSLIEWQDSKVENIHVVFLPSGGFQLFYNKEKFLDKNYLDGFLLDCEEDVINYDDLLISSLINISPQNIVIHLNAKHQYSEMLKIILQVFEDRVTVCKGCERCQSLLSKKN